jgi:uncharacterized repeat protein (TIGR01451 family)
MRTTSEARYIALVLLACLVLAWTASAATQATITTDAKHYSVGATINIVGTGFTPHVLISLWVLTPSHNTEIVPGVTTDTQGTFTAEYTPVDQEPGRYTITATDGANTAITATTEADSIGFNKGVYKKANTTYKGGQGSWTTGDAGSNYLENQWAFYQYQAAGFTSQIPDFDVQYNYHQANTNAIFIDAFANLRACVTAYTSNGKIVQPNNCLGTGSNGMLEDGLFAPPPDPDWIDAHTAISNINHSIAAGGGSCASTVDPADTVVNDIHCFHVDGTALRALLVAANANTFNVNGAASYSVTLYYAAHLSSTNVWSNGKEAFLGCSTDLTDYVVKTNGANYQGAGAEFVPAASAGGIFGTDVYRSPGEDPCGSPLVAGVDWTTNIFSGIGAATGSSRHFTLANPQINGVAIGSQGSITLPIPSVPPSTGSITFKKVTNPADSGASSFSFSGDFNFTLDTNSTDATFPNSITFGNLEAGNTYSVTETEPTSWAPAGNAVCVNSSGTSSFTTTGTTASITLSNTSGAAVTCTFTNNQLTPALSITKVADAATVNAGDPIGFVVTVKNTGTGTASGVTVSDPLPAGSGAHVTWAIASQSNTGLCTLAGSSPSQTLNCGGSTTSLAAGLSFSVHITASTSSAECGVYNNTASFTTTNDGSGNAQASITCNKPNLTITKVADATSVNAGSSIGFTVTLTSTGPGTAMGAILTDSLPGGTGTGVTPVTWSISPANAACGLTGGAGSQILTCGPATLAVNASITVHVTATTSATACGVYNNTAMFTTSNDGSGNASASITCSQAPPVCPAVSIASNFNGTAIAKGDFIWFNSVLNVKGLGSTPVTIHFTGQTITSADFSLVVPDAYITFDPAAVSATTVFDTANNAWRTTVPSSGLAGNTFLSGLAFLVPARLPGGINPVTWSGSFISDTPGVTVQWQWAAAVYTSFSTDYTTLGVKPVDDNKASQYQNSDHAGTPENFKSFVIGGARGGGGSNYTGSYSATGSVTPCTP